MIVFTSSYDILQGLLPVIIVVIICLCELNKTDVYDKIFRFTFSVDMCHTSWSRANLIDLLMHNTSSVILIYEN